MAANSRSERFNQISRSFKDRLQALECPLTEEVDESWIVQLIFTPGEPRIKLLQWLFSRFDTKLADLLDAQYIPTDTRMDARLQRLLYISSVLGLSGPDDIDLIRGASTKGKQIAYMDQLLDLVCIVDASEDPAKRAMSSPGLIDESLSLREQVEHDYQLIDCIAREQDINSLFSSELTLLPPDLMKQMQKSLKEQGITSQQQYSPPDYQNLLEVLSEVAKQLIKSTTHLEELKHNYAYPEYEEQLSERVCKTMQLVLSELAQLVTGFTFTFENEIRQWCNRAPPVLTDIGAAFKTVYTLLQKFTDILQSFSSVKTSFLNVSQKAETTLQRDSSTGHGPTKLASACTEGMDTLRNCINILETSVSARSVHSARK